MISDRRAIEEALAYGAKNGGAVLFAEARDPRKWQAIANSPAYRDYFGALARAAEELLRTPVEPLPYSSFKLFWETGSRREYEEKYFARRVRLGTLALLALAAGEAKYLEALDDAVWAVCDEFTWCLPAHLGGTPREGRDLEEAARALDLFSAETAFTLAEIVCLLDGEGRPTLAPPVAARARREVFRRVLEPYLHLAQPMWWESAGMNWAAVCAGSIGAAALYLMEEADRLALLLQRVLQTMASYLDGFGADGACPEGVSYWAYGFGYFTYFAALLLERTGGALDLFRAEKTGAIASFLQKCYLGGNRVASFSDAPLAFDYQPGLLAYLQQRFKEVAPPAEGCADLARGIGTARWPEAVRNLVWGTPRTERAGETEEAAFYLGDAGWLIAREKAGGLCVSFAAKGGHNGEPHNHNDIGSFILQVNGDPLLVDPGRGEYTREYFGPGRYRHFCAGSQGHSVPIVDGCRQKEGRERAARILERRSTGREEVLVMEMAAAYGHPNLRSLVRSFVFTKADPPSLLVIDEFVFETSPDSLVERFVSFCEPAVPGPGRIRLAGARGLVEIEYPHPGMELHIGREVFTTQDDGEKTAYTLDLVHLRPETKVSIRLKFLCARGDVTPGEVG